MGFLACAAGGSSAAGAFPFIDARAILSWREFDAGSQKTEGFRQTYDLGLRRAISDPLLVRLWFRADAGDSSFELADDRSSSDFDQLKVGGEVTLSYPKLQLQATWDDIATDLSGDRTSQRDLDRTTAVLSWRPDGLPDLSVEVEDRGFRDELRGDDDSDQRLQATLSETVGALFLSAGVRTQDRENAGGAVRATDDVFGQATLNHSFFEGRLDASAQLYFLESRIEERGPALGGAPVSEQVPIAAASTGIDETPEDSRDRPLDPAGELIDGFFFTTGVDLGPSGENFRNVALDFGRFANVDELWLHVRDAAGNLVPTGGAIDWRLYTSTDTLDWSLAGPGVVSAYDPGRSLYRITFPRRSTRFLKVVAFGLDILDASLVEVEAFDSQGLGAGERRDSDSFLGSADASLTARPNDRVTLFWAGRWNVFERTPAGGPESRTDDDTQFASILVEATEWADVQVRHERRGVAQADNAFRQDFRQTAAELILRPRPGLDFRAEALESDEETNSTRTRSEGLALKSHARLWRAVDVRLDVGELRSDVDSEGITRVRRFANGWVIARLTDGLTMTNNLSRTRSRVDGGDGGAEATADEDTRVSTELFWRPGAQLGLGARIGRVSQDDFSATTRSFRLEWNPFRGGSLRLGTLYNEEVDTFTRRTFRRLSLTPGWTINRHASLHVNYTVFDYDTGTPRTRSLLVNLTVRD